MKTRYYIGFLGVIILFTVLLDAGYRKTYENAVTRQSESLEENPTVAADGQADKNTGYYLQDQNGYVIVYLFDQKTVYECTSIRMDSLPSQLRDEILDTKYIENTEELYGFLENYSS